MARVVYECLRAKIPHLILGGIHPLRANLQGGYADFREISPEHSRDNDKRKCVGKFGYLTYFSRSVHLRNTSRVFLATPTLDADI